MSDPEYEIRIHKRAEKELGNVTGKQGDELLERLRKLKKHEQPTTLSFVKQMEDHKELFTVRVDGYRALCRLNKPAIEVLVIATRSRVYDQERINTAKERGSID